MSMQELEVDNTKKYVQLILIFMNNSCFPSVLFLVWKPLQYQNNFASVFCRS